MVFILRKKGVISKKRVNSLVTVDVNSRKRSVRSLICLKNPQKNLGSHVTHFKPYETSDNPIYTPEISWNPMKPLETPLKALYNLLKRSSKLPRVIRDPRDLFTSTVIWLNTVSCFLHFHFSLLPISLSSKFHASDFPVQIIRNYYKTVY